MESLLNYQRLMALKPTIYETITNQLGQKIDLVEHPTLGDQSQVIAIYHEQKVARYTGFYDTEDFYEDSEYNPLYLHGELLHAYEQGI